MFFQPYRDKGKRIEDKKEKNKRKQHVPRNEKEKDTRLLYGKTGNVGSSQKCLSVYY
jgi:hypothetical protein